MCVDIRIHRASSIIFHPACQHFTPKYGSCEINRRISDNPTDADIPNFLSDILCRVMFVHVFDIHLRVVESDYAAYNGE